MRIISIHGRLMENLIMQDVARSIIDKMRVMSLGELAVEGLVHVARHFRRVESPKSFRLVELLVVEIDWYR